MKHDNWHNKEYMESVKKDIVKHATALMNNNVPFLEGIRTLNSIQHEVIEKAHDVDFMIFVAIDSETDNLPSEGMRNKCSKSWLKQTDIEINKIKNIYEKQVYDACKKLISRFGSNATRRCTGILLRRASQNPVS